MIEYEVDDEHLIDEQNRMGNWCVFGMKLDDLINN